MSSSPLPDPAPLLEVLEQARTYGFLGPGPVAPHIEHAAAFAAASPEPPARAIDLGSGGGVPGLILAIQWPASAWVLLDATKKRIEFLEVAIDRLGLRERVGVHLGRAESYAADPANRETFDLATARSFGTPAVVVECAAAVIRVGGCIVVSEPPDDDPGRWSTEGLAALRLQDEGRIAGPVSSVRRIRKAGPTPPGYPRPVGVPSKRPLW